MVYIFESGARERIAQVEGENWLRQDGQRVHPNSFQFWLNEWNNKSEPFYGGTIYGMGGWHRYFVREDGEIQFSERHAGYNSEKACAKAREAGFTISH